MLHQKYGQQEYEVFKDSRFEHVAQKVVLVAQGTEKGREKQFVLFSGFD